MKKSTKTSQSSKQIVLCVDIGTSSIKAALINNLGAVLTTTRISFEKELGSNRWFIALKKAVKQFSTTTSLEKIQAISISGNGPSLANKDFSYLWDEPLSKNVQNKITTFSNNGKPCLSIFIPRLMHIQEKMPEIWSRAHSKNLTPSSQNEFQKIFSLPEYLVFQLTGKAHTLLPEIRYKNAYWTNESLKTFGLLEQPPITSLPPFKLLLEQAGYLTSSAAKKLGITTDKTEKENTAIKVFCTGPDFIAALLGTANVLPGNICDRAGTSEGINLCTTRPILNKNVRTLPSPIKDLWNASCIIPDSGLLFTNKKNKDCPTLNYHEYVDFLLHHKDSDGYQLMKKIAYDIKAKFDFLEQLSQKENIPFATIVCTGGQSKNPEWMQFKANILKRPLHVFLCEDSELIGCAIVAFTALGCYDSMSEAAKKLTQIGTIYTPK